MEYTISPCRRFFTANMDNGNNTCRECISQLCCTGCRKNRPHGNAIGGERPKGARGNIRNAFPYEPFQRSLLPLSGRRVCRCPIPRVPLVTLALPLEPRVSFATLILPWVRFLLPLPGRSLQMNSHATFFHCRPWTSVIVRVTI